MNKDVIIALDFENKETTLAFLDKFQNRKPFVKIGMELFYSEGPEIVREIKERGHKVFLDLKLHDIPNTVEKAMARLAGLGVDMVNVHATGTCAMMEAALRGLNRGGGETLLIAVTQLTSTDEETMQKELLINRPLSEVVKEYALNAKKAGLAGVVCSPLEATLIHGTCGEGFVTVTPGIRFKDLDPAAASAAGADPAATNSAPADDQKRITSPAEARSLGSDFIVVGRPITQADNPVQAYERCIAEFLG